MQIGHDHFEEIYTQYYARFVIIARRYVRDPEVAQDLVMDGFAAFWENRDKLPVDVNIPGYITTIIKNRCLDWLYAQRLHLQKQMDMHSLQNRLNAANIRSLNACNPGRLFSAEVIEIVQRELENLPELTRKVFEAHRFYNKTYAEIADELGIPVRRVTTEMQRALSRLKVALKDYLPVSLIFLNSATL